MRHRLRPRAQWARFFCGSLCAYLLSCASSTAPTEPIPNAAKASASPAGEGSGKREASEQPAPITAARRSYYRAAFPKASVFVPRTIPSLMIMPYDRGNDTYVEARNDDGAIVGYLRDFTGPVNPSNDCGCSPLQITLAFDRDRVPKTILSAKPLEKLEHEPFTTADTARLIALLRDPPEPLMAVRSTHAMVDGVSGATVKELQPHVVQHAALTTHRIVQLAIRTSRILHGAPVSRDRKRLEAMLLAAKSPAAKAAALARFLPTAESTELVRQAYRAMARSYGEALAAGGKTDQQVERILLEPPLSSEEAPREQAAACYGLVDRGVGVETVRKCVSDLKRKQALPPPLLAYLHGTLQAVEGDVVAAAASLKAATYAVSMQEDPRLHLRFAQSLIALGRLNEACEVGKQLFRHHPALPDVRTALVGCRALGEDIEAVLGKIREQQRHDLVATLRGGDEPAPLLSVEGPQLQTIDLELGQAGAATVLVVFSTWCPHCQSELPEVVSFVDSLRSDSALRDRVRVIGLRTAIERETEPYEAFAERMQLNFPVWLDATMSMAFSRFTRALGLDALLPTTAVLDEKGVLRFVMPRGDFRDVSRELRWAIEAVLSTQSG